MLQIYIGSIEYNIATTGVYLMSPLFLSINRSSSDCDSPTASDFCWCWQLFDPSMCCLWWSSPHHLLEQRQQWADQQFYGHHLPGCAQHKWHDIREIETWNLQCWWGWCWAIQLFCWNICFQWYCIFWAVCDQFGRYIHCMK